MIQDQKKNLITFFLYTVTTTYEKKTMSANVHHVFYKNTKQKSVFCLKINILLVGNDWLCKLFLLKTNDQGI